MASSERFPYLHELPASAYFASLFSNTHPIASGTMLSYSIYAHPDHIPARVTINAGMVNLSLALRMVRNAAGHVSSELTSTGAQRTNAHARQFSTMTRPECPTIFQHILSYDTCTGLKKMQKENTTAKDSDQRSHDHSPSGGLNIAPGIS